MASLPGGVKLSAPRMERCHQVTHVHPVAGAHRLQGGAWGLPHAETHTVVACNLNAAPDAMRRIERGLSAPHAAHGASACCWVVLCSAAGRPDKTADDGRLTTE